MAVCIIGQGLSGVRSPVTATALRGTIDRSLSARAPQRRLPGGFYRCGWRQWHPAKAPAASLCRHSLAGGFGEADVSRRGGALVYREWLAIATLQGAIDRGAVINWEVRRGPTP
jgi:hypothetical protein